MLLSELIRELIALQEKLTSNALIYVSSRDREMNIFSIYHGDNGNLWIDVE